MKTGKYERYKRIMSKQEFFDLWEQEKIEPLTEQLKDYIYNKYVFKSKVFKRDGFACQNIDGKDGKCGDCHNRQYYSGLTVHHVKFKKNNGEDKVRNGVTVCKPRHLGYHNAKSVLTFPDMAALPSHIGGHTFKLGKQDRAIDWKGHKAKMKKLRQDVKSRLSAAIKQLPVGNRRWFALAAKEVLILLMWLYSPTDEEDEDE